MAQKARATERMGKLERWSAKPMAEDEKRWVRATLQRIAEAKGEVTAAVVRAMCRSSTMTDRFRGQGRPSASDVVWAWVAEQQTQRTGLIEEGLQRRSTAKHAEPEPRWQWHATVRSGWVRPDDISRESVETLRQADRVLAALWREHTGTPQGEGKDDEVGSGTLRVEEGMVRATWGKVKSGFTGKGGYKWYLSVVALLMLMGKVEGGVGVSPRKSWWAKGQQLAKDLLGDEAATVQETVQPPVGSACPVAQGEGTRRVRVVVDWMACTQSLRRVVPQGVHYIGYDRQEWVFSGSERVWVQNEVADLMTLDGPGLYARVKQDMSRRLGEEVEVVIALLGMSPCCRTFTKTDSSNQSRGHNYRDHTHPHRPPRDRVSVKGKAAMEADRMVRQGIGVASWLAKHKGVKFYMENPVGSLWRRPDMRQWEMSREVVRQQVDYCAYGHMYMKPTHIWTNMKGWVLTGLTGTGGRCCECCSAGERSAETGKWVHKCKIAQGSWQAAGGLGRKARKNMMPEALQRELLQAAMK